MIGSVRSGNGLGIALAIGLVVGLTGCATTRQTRTVEESGFLRDYSQLKEGGEGEAKLVYIRSNTPWAKYDKMMIDPVTIWVSDDSSVANVPEEERQLLADYLDSSLRRSLGKDYRLVDEPGPDTLRMRVAITDAKGARVALNTLSKVIPQLRMLTTVGGLASGTQVLVGRTGAEAEILDSVSGQRLAAAVDRRAGTKALRGGVSTWADVQNAFDYWAERTRTRLESLRKGG